MNYNDMRIYKGGRKYGEGAKGYIIDIFKQNDDDYFLKESTQKKKYTYKLIKYNPKKEGNKIEFIDTTYEDISKLKDNKLKDFLIKVYNKPDIYKIEQDLVINFISDGLNDDYILNGSNEYIIGIQKNNENNALLKRKCQLTLDKFRVYYTDNIDEFNILEEKEKENKIFSLRLAFGFILLNIIELQKKQYVHCDIKADNIMVCGGVIKIIDWDLAVKNISYTKDHICNLNYHGSATHQSPLITKYLYNPKIICNKEDIRIVQKKLITLSKSMKRRNVPLSSNKINDNAKNHFKNTENLEHFIRYHLDLYSISVVLYELCGKKFAIDDMDETKVSFIKDIKEFIKILQNTIKVEPNDTDPTKIIFTYYNETDDTEKTINFCDLLKKFDKTLYIIPKDLRDILVKAKAEVEAKKRKK